MHPNFWVFKGLRDLGSVIWVPLTCCGMGILVSPWKTQAFYLSSQHRQTKRGPHPGGRRECVQIVTWLNREGAQYWKSGKLVPCRKLGEQNTLCKLLKLELTYSKCALWSWSLLRALESDLQAGLRSRRRLPRRGREIRSPVQSKPPSPCTETSQVKTCPGFSGS